MHWFLELPIAWKVLILYIALVSLLSVFVCIYDKIISKANKVNLRIPEKSLFVWSAAGGSVAMYITMQVIRHKTKHPSFMIGIPIIIILQTTLIWALVHFGVLPPL